jgi:hypothetical protein
MAHILTGFDDIAPSIIGNDMLDLFDGPVNVSASRLAPPSLRMMIYKPCCTSAAEDSVCCPFMEV